MLQFFAGSFAVAGLIAGAGPLIIHLLNRRRFRRVEWGAMEFLRRAIRRSRRAVELRDLLVLVLRCLAVVLFGAGLARPFLSGAAGAAMLSTVLIALAVVGSVGCAAAGILARRPRPRTAAFLGSGLLAAAAALGLFDALRAAGGTSLSALSGRQPVHAVLLIDNSQSMSFESLEGTLLDRARRKAVEFVEAVPAGSQFHVIPLCGTDAAIASSVYRSRADALAALRRIQVQDRVARAGFALDLATEVCRRVPELPSKRVVLLTDQQESLWSAAALDTLGQLPDVQVLRIAPEHVENVAVTELSVRDGVADTQSPAAFLATVRNFGSEPLRHVQVTLRIDGTDVAGQIVDLEPGQVRQIEFQQRLDAVTDTGALGGAATATYINATVTATPEGGVGDRLPRDNTRHIVVPVVAGLPVVFVDQFGQTENLDRGDVGETYRLRRLLAPRSAEDDGDRPLIRIRHVMVDELTQQLLSDARLVVMAGVPSPGDAVPLLRQYVEQGGPLVIAAGADFDPAAWTGTAWDAGAGILPAPLAAEPVGQTPEVALGAPEVFRLDVRSLQHDFFQIEGESEEALADLYRLPLFFKAVRCDVRESVVSELLKTETQRIETQRRSRDAADRSGSSGATETPRESDPASAAASSGKAPDSVDEATAAARFRPEDADDPDWLIWPQPDVRARMDELPVSMLAERSRPRVLARYDRDDLPFLVERRIGAGRVLLVTSGLYSSWNTLTGTNAILMFDRMLRRLLEDTLPPRNFETGDVVTLPAQRSTVLRREVQKPDGSTEPLTVEALSADRFGVRVSQADRNGHYRVRTFDTSVDPPQEQESVSLAFHCPAEESDLTPLETQTLQEQTRDSGIRWLGADDSLSLDGARIQGRDLWKWLIIAVLACLLAEMLILARPPLQHSDAAPAAP